MLKRKAATKRRTIDRRSRRGWVRGVPRRGAQRPAARKRQQVLKVTWIVYRRHRYRVHYTSGKSDFAYRAEDELRRKLPASRASVIVTKRFVAGVAVYIVAYRLTPTRRSKKR